MRQLLLQNGWIELGKTCISTSLGQCNDFGKLDLIFKNKHMT